MSYFVILRLPLEARSLHAGTSRRGSHCIPAPFQDVWPRSVFPSHPVWQFCGSAPITPTLQKNHESCMSDRPPFSKLVPARSRMPDFAPSNDVPVSKKEDVRFLLSSESRELRKDLTGVFSALSVT